MNPPTLHLALTAARRRAGRLLLTALTALLALSPGCSPNAPTPEGAAGKAVRYHCPMHPSYVSDRAGDCPICNMKLVPIGDTAAPATPGASNAPADRVAIHVSPEKQQRIGLQTARVEARELTDTVYAAGVIQHDETTLTRIAPRVGGWIVKLHVSFVGQAVEAGQPLLTVYSPDLRVAEQEYLLARQANPTQHSTEPGGAAQRLVETARQRLLLAGVGDEEIAALEQRGTASDELLLRAPVSGHVIAKTAVEGRSFMPGESLFEIGQLSRLWVRATVSEGDLARLRLGQKARVILTHPERRALKTTVAFISPHLDATTRRGEVRLEIENPDHLLRPDMWVSVEMDLDLGTTRVVPASAVLDTGTRTLVFVKTPEDHLEPREVRIGARTDDWWAVPEGLAEGELVVTRALFLIDSESQLKAVVAAMTADASHAHP